MSSRINELAVQAGGIWQGGYVEQTNGDSVYTDKKFVSGGDMDVEQFARLLVKECMDCSSWVGKMNTNSVEPVHTAHAINQRIKKHFGVGP